IDAGDLGAGHSVTALYEIVPPDALPVQRPNEPNVDPLKYQSAESKGASTPDPDSDPPTVNSQLSSDLPPASEELRSLFNLLVEERQLLEEYGAEHPKVIAVRKKIEETRRRLQKLGVNKAISRTASPELLTVKLRYKPALPVGSRLSETVTDESVKLEFPLVDDTDKQAPSNNLNWSAAVASFGMLLRNSSYRGNATFDAVLELARDAMDDDHSGQRAEFIDMVLKARQLHRQSHGTDSPPPLELSSLEARRKASLDGRYDDLLDKIQRPEDFKQYGAFHNRGWWTGPQDADEKGFPAGYWVYVYPHWYVWSETVGTDTDETPSR
ncbi:MAG: DUF3520 domain-containing protein, partial [Planctomycetaceae bacterium]|nr:DUF3520 domain-containing protein [Planctomycetaceae bacterium]